MTNKNKLYRVKHLNGDISAPLTREEANQLMIIRRGEIVTDRPGWSGCWWVIASVALVLIWLISLCI